MPPCDFKPEEFKVKSICPPVYPFPFSSCVVSLSRECPKSECWRSASRIASPWPWKLPSTRNQCSSTRVTCSGCGTWTGSGTWIFLPAWLPSAWATVTRKVLGCISVTVYTSGWLLLLYACVGRYRKVMEAAERQLKRLWHTTNIYIYPTLHEYCEKLASNLPDSLKVHRLSSSPLFSVKERF